MGETTKIEWCHHTWSPWWGCTKVSAGCANCYAESWSNRWGIKIWGQDANRRFFNESHWKLPVKYNREAGKAGERRRIFPSMCDPFEERPDLDEPRERMFKLIDATPHLDWLLLTKRPENIRSMWPGAMYRRNVWLLTSVENQAAADLRIPRLLMCRGLVPVVGLSVEPLLGPISLRDTPMWWTSESGALETGEHPVSGIDWVIVGGESGPKARPMHPEWARSIRDQCLEAGVPFVFKQWGEFGTIYYSMDSGVSRFVQFKNRLHWVNKASTQVKGGICIDAAGKILHNGGDFDRASYPVTVMHRVGKKRAGRELDGKIWDQMPEVKILGHSTGRG